MNRNWIPRRLPAWFTDHVALAVIVMCGLLLLLVGCSGTPEHVITIPAEAPDAPPPAPHTPVDHFGDGQHEVIDQVKPGLYRTGGSTVEGYPLCSWKLFLRGDQLIASGSASGPVSIVIEPQYSAVQSQGCQEWRRVGDAP